MAYTPSDNHLTKTVLDVIGKEQNRKKEQTLDIILIKIQGNNGKCELCILSMWKNNIK